MVRLRQPITKNSARVTKGETDMMTRKDIVYPGKMPGLVFAILTCLVIGGCDDETGSDGADGGDSNECGVDYGMWQDPATNLCWSSGSGTVDWQGAMDYCEGLEDGDFSDWRVPNIDELRSIVDGCEAIMPGGACPIHDGSGSDSLTPACHDNDCGVNDGPSELLGCYNIPDMGDVCGGQWSSSIDASDSGKAFIIQFTYGDLGPNDTGYASAFKVHCIR